MFVMAFLANKPFALALGMGLNSFFEVIVFTTNTIGTCHDFTIIFGVVPCLTTIKSEEIRFDLASISIEVIVKVVNCLTTCGEVTILISMVPFAVYFEELVFNLVTIIYSVVANLAIFSNKFTFNLGRNRWYLV